jgi:hypothetical protein
MAVLAAALALADDPVAGAGPLAVGPPIVAHPLRTTPATAATALSQVLRMQFIISSFSEIREFSQKRCQVVCKICTKVLEDPG